MTSEQWARVRDLLHRALDRPPDERAEWVAAACEGTPEIRAEVESLLDAYEADDPFFEAEQIPDGTAPDDAPARFATGTQVGEYRLLEEVGIGGMSVVYRAERTGTDVEQTVAVKLLQRRLHTGDAEQRFRAERQVLASLDHPNIAQFIDGGITEGGRPYFVMEYVEGLPITEYADARELDLSARLDLLTQVFDAVQAAHRQLVVHRDLKPSNVLVTETDRGPQVKLLDFGLAKMLGGATVPGPRPETRTGLHLITPAYAAPEQVGDGEITTATDIYQLGVLAYELLAGARPFDLVDVSLTEVERIVREQPPEKPSENAGAGGASLRGDLDVILLKALRKDPDRRYRSVEALAADLERYREGAPVEARPATLGYRARKFVARNRGAVGAGLLIVLLAIAYAVTVTVQANRLAIQRNRARREAQTARTVSSFMQGVLGRRPGRRSRNVTLQSDLNLFSNWPRAGELRTEIRTHLNRQLARTEDPRIRAALLHTVGDMLVDNHLYNWADSLLHRGLTLRRRHLGPAHTATLRTLGTLARSKFKGGRLDSARVFYRRYLRRQRRRGVVDSTRYTVASWHYAVTLADSTRRASRFNAALDLVDATFGPLSLERARAQLQYAARIETPVPHRLENALSILRRRVDSLHTKRIYTHLRLGEDYVETGRVRAGLRHARTAIRRFDRTKAVVWRQYAQIKYAQLLAKANRLGRARTVLAAVRDWQNRHLPRLHKDRAFWRYVRGWIALRRARYDAAASHLRGALEKMATLYGPMVWESRRNRYLLARSVWKQGERGRTVSLLKTNAQFSGEAGRWVRRSRRLLDSLQSSAPSS